MKRSREWKAPELEKARNCFAAEVLPDYPPRASVTSTTVCRAERTEHQVVAASVVNTDARPKRRTGAFDRCDIDVTEAQGDLTKILHAVHRVISLGTPIRRILNK